MNKRILIAFRVISALALATVTSGLLPAATVYAAPKNDVAVTASTKNKDVNDKAYGQVKKQETRSQSNTPQTSSASTVRTDSAGTTYNTSATKVHNPAGNNGFIKVNEEVIPDSIPNNDPHVGCSFKVEFYNYDQNPDYKARVNFALHNPTAGDGYTMSVNGNTNPFIGGDSAGGGNDLDAVETYMLDFTGNPHPKQGYHVKLTIHADGSRGADVKHKVFWVQPCNGGVAGAQNGKGSTLGTSTGSTASKVSVLPSTGTGVIGIITAVLVSMAAYLAALRGQKYRFNS